jgi:hypothetical protein
MLGRRACRYLFSHSHTHTGYELRCIVAQLQQYLCWGSRAILLAVLSTTQMNVLLLCGLDAAAVNNERGAITQHMPLPMSSGHRHKTADATKYCRLNRVSSHTLRKHCSRLTALTLSRLPRSPTIQLITVC